MDHASAKIFNHCQVSLRAGETMRGKMLLELLAHESGFSIKQYHTDNGVFASEEFKQHCMNKAQTLKFSGVGAHHQNGVAERAIGTVTKWARANLIFLALHWPEKHNVRLWPMALDYAIWIYNRLPRLDSKLSPDEIWTQLRSSHQDLRCAHVFGCPVYVLSLIHI